MSECHSGVIAYVSERVQVEAVCGKDDEHRAYHEARLDVKGKDLYNTTNPRTVMIVLRWKDD